MSKVIWIINQTAGKPDSGWGERHYYLSKYWVRKGYKVYIVSGSYNHLFINQPIIEGKTFALERVEEGITFCWVKVPTYNAASVFKLWSMFVFTFKILFLNKKLLGKPDLILVSSMPIFPILSGWFLKKKYNAKKLLFEIRDLWPLTPIYLKGYQPYHPIVIIMKWFEKFGYKNSDHIISLLPNANIYIDKISKNPQKFKWIPNGIDKELLINEILPINIVNQIPKDKFIVCYAGTLGLANAMEYFAKASVLLKNDTSIHFLCVGDGYLKSDLVSITNGNNNITFLDKINKSQVQSLLKLVDICFAARFDNPLYQYGVSYNKYFDYMLAEKPVLVSSNEIMDPVQLSGCGITVEPESPQSIVNGILKLKSMSNKSRYEMGKKGYEYVIKYHNFELLSNLYEQLFQSKENEA